MSELREAARWLSKELSAGRDAVKALSAPQLANSSIEAGKVEEYDAEGTLVSVVGEQFDGTHAAVTLAGPVPPEPAAPTVTPGINTAEVRWNGKFVDDALSPMDFSHVTVHASRLEAFEPDATTQRATITGESGDTATLALDSGEWYFLLVAVSKAGKWSDPSEAVLGEVQDFLQDAVTDALIDLDTKYDGVIQEAGELDGRLQTAESDLVEHETRLGTNEASLNTLTGTTLPALQTDLNNAKTTLAPLPGLVDANKTAVASAKTRLDTLDSTTLPALNTSLTDARTRLGTAETTLAPLPAKVDQAQTDLTTAFGQLGTGTVDSRISTAKTAALTTAAADAQTKADAAKAAAIAAAATDAQTKADAARARAEALWAQGTNLLENSSLENGVLYSNATATTELSTTASIKIITDATKAHTGSKYMEMSPPVSPGTSTTAHLKTVPVSPDRTYRIGVWVYAEALDANKSFGMPFYWLNAASSLINNTWPKLYYWAEFGSKLTIGAWTYMAADIQPPLGAVKMGTRFYIDNNNTTTRLRFDDVTVVDVTDALKAEQLANAAQSTANAAQAAAGAAGDNATAALTMAGSKSKVYYNTTAATGVATADGDLWRQRDASNNIIAEWRWDTSLATPAWVKTMIHSDAVANLDVGKLTAGAATIDTAVVNKMAVQIATVIQLNADRITAGKITSGQIDTAALAVTLATILQLNADRITAGTIATARLDVDALSVAIASIIQLNADRITAGTINTARLNATEVAAAVATVIQLNADRIVAGTIATARLDVVDIAAKTAAFQTVDVKNLFATTGTLDTAVINKLWTDVVNSRKITTTMLAVGSFDNIIPDPEFTNTNSEWGAPGGLYTFPATEGRSGGGAFKIAPTTLQAGKYSTRIRATGAATYLLSVWVKSDAAIPAGGLGLYFNRKLTATGGIGGIANVLKQSNGAAGNDAIPADTWTRLTGLVTVDATWYDFALGFYKQTNFTTGTTWFSDPIATRMNAGELTVDGTVTARQLQANLALISDIIAGNPAGQHARMTPTGFKVLAPVDGGAPAEVVRMGNSDGTDVVAVVGTDGLVKAGMSAEGDVTAQDVVVANDITMAGDSLLDRLNAIPRGVVAWRQFPRSGSNYPTLATAGGEIGLFEIGWDTSQDNPARLYSVSVPPILLKATSGGTAGTVGLVMRYTDDGTAPTVNSTLIVHDYGYVSSGGFGSRGFNDVLISSANGPYIRVLVTMWANVGVSVDPAGLPQVIVEDKGLAIPQTGSITTGGGGSNPPPTDPVVTKTVTYSSTSVQSYLGNNAQYSYNPGKGYQGLQPGTANGNLKSLWTFPSVTGILSGATVNKIEAYFYFEHWNNGSGGTARIVAHGNSGQPATYSSLILAISSPNWPRGAGRWVTIPSSLYAGFKSGTYKGFGLEGDGTYNTYGIANAAKIRLTYTK